MKKNYALIVVVFILILLEVFLATSIAYFSNSNNAAGSITLGELDFSVINNFEKDMSVLPNAKILCDLTVVNAKENGSYENLIDFYFRFKLQAKSEKYLIQVEPIFFNNYWFKYEDFYYYKKIVRKNESVNICDYVVVDKDTGNEVQGKDMEITVFFEAIQYNAVLELWGEEVFKYINI